MDFSFEHLRPSECFNSPRVFAYQECKPVVLEAGATGGAKKLEGRDPTYRVFKPGGWLRSGTTVVNWAFYAHIPMPLFYAF